MSKEAKPIAVVYIQRRFDHEDNRHMQSVLSEVWTDYHVIVVPNPDQERAIELEVFYDKDFTDTNYEELRKWIADYITPSPPTENKP